MRRKITVLSLIFLFLLSQTAFAPLQAAEETAANAFPSELISLLSDSDVVTTVDVRRMLNETAPDLLNNDPVAMEKLKKVVKLIEDETGIDPTQVDQIAAGINFKEKKPEDFALIIRTLTPATGVAEKLFQKEAADARLAMEKNPLRNRLANLRLRADSFSEVFADNSDGVADGARAELAESTQKFNSFSDKLGEIRQVLAEVKASPAVIGNLNSTLERVSASQGKYVKLFYTVNELKFAEESARIAELEKKLLAISPADPQRSQKLSSLGVEITAFEKSFAEKIRAIEIVGNFRDSETGSPLSDRQLNNALSQLQKLPAAGVRRTRSLQIVQSQLTDFSNQLEKRYSEAEAKKDSGFETGQFYPTYVSASKTDETIGGKKTLVITTKSRLNGERGADAEGDSTAEKAILFYDDKTIILGSKKDLARLIVAGQSAAGGANENQQRISRMLGKVPNSLVSFAVNLQGFDLGGMNDLLGDQDKVWEIYGGWTSVSKEMTLSVNVEKSDIPLVLAPKSATESGTSNKLKIPVVEDNSAAADLFKLLAKTVVGAEGKFTLKFEKRKIARLVRETPKLLGAILHDGESGEANISK